MNESKPRLYAIIRHILRPGMRRVIDLYVIKGNEPRWIGRRADITNSRDPVWSRGPNAYVKSLEPKYPLLLGSKRRHTMADTPFEGILGDTIALRVAEFLVAMKGQRLFQNEIAVAVDASRQAVAESLSKFEEWNIVTSAKRGTAREYEVNEHSPLVYAFAILNGAIIEELTGETIVAVARDYAETVRTDRD